MTDSSIEFTIFIWSKHGKHFISCNSDFNKSFPLGKVGEEYTFKQIWKGDKFPLE